MFQDFAHIEGMNNKALDPRETRAVENQMFGNAAEQKKAEQLKEAEKRKQLDELLDKAQAIDKNSPKLSKYQSSVTVSNTDRKQLAKKKPVSYPHESHIYGVKPLPSDDMNGIVQMQYAE